MDNEMVTPTLKLKKSVIMDRFKDHIDAMYK
jgi:long-subunit acyl-CoA synthetase (AMP-forming)